MNIFSSRGASAKNSLCISPYNFDNVIKGITGCGLGFSKLKHEMSEAQFVVEPMANSERICEQAELICKLISNEQGDIPSRLDQVGVVISQELTAEVLKKLSNAGMLALAFFRWAQKQEGFKHTTDSYHNLIEALGKIKQFRLIWTLVDFMKEKGLLRRETFALVIRRYARARKMKEAVETFEKMESFGLRPNLSDYNSLLDTLCKSKNVRRAQKMFYEMKRRERFVPDVKTYTILMEGWGNERDLLQLKGVYEEMKAQGLKPDVVTYGILISAFCKAKRCDDALAIFHEMEAKRYKPSPHIYCSLINGLGSEKRLNDALNIFELSKSSGFAPETPTYNAVVGAYCSVVQFKDAFKVVEEMKKLEIGPNARTYDIILHHLIKQGRIEEAFRIFQGMTKEAGCEPQLNTYTMIVGMFCSAERVDMALKVWSQMHDKGILPCMHMFSSLINGLCHENRLEDACRYFQEMLDKGIRPPGQLFGKLKDALLDGGRKDLAVDLGLKLDNLRKTQMMG